MNSPGPLPHLDRNEKASVVILVLSIMTAAIWVLSNNYA